MEKNKPMMGDTAQGDNQARLLRVLPSIDRLLGLEAVKSLEAAYGRPLTLQSLREAVETIRLSILQGQAELITLPNDSQGLTALILTKAEENLAAWLAPTLKPVINATGVILHTNLGRSPLSAETIRAMAAVSAGYSTLEYDLERGQRGSRSTHVESLIQKLTGAEAAYVVNNNAAAVLLVLSALAHRKQVVISRTQLVEIGGSFRIPDVMRQSGARLVEVGATNRVHLRDYEQVFLEPPPGRSSTVAMLLTAHWSNFKIIGFTSEPALSEIAALARKYQVPLVSDLGSGTFLDTAVFGLAHEQTVPETLAAGADIVTFSGDKLLGGPQAGIIAGRADLLAKIKKHPLARAVRPDKVCLAGLAATFSHYLKDEALEKIPVWQMISLPLEAIEKRAKAWADQLSPLLENRVSVIPGVSTVGGGSLPGETLPTWLVALDVPSPQRFLKRLRQASSPVIGRVQEERVVLDPRTVFPEQDKILVEELRAVL